MRDDHADVGLPMAFRVPREADGCFIGGRDAAETNYRFSSIVMGIAQSAPFQMERVPEPAPSQAQVASAH